MCRHVRPSNPLSPHLTAPVLAAASLELKAEKQSAHSEGVSSVAFSPDGKSIVSGSRDQTIKVWDAGVIAAPSNPMLKPECSQTSTASLKLKAKKKSAHSSSVYSVAFSPDGKTIVSGSSDRTVKVWALGTKKTWFGQEAGMQITLHSSCGTPPILSVNM